eukprot:6171187-Pleurochrysis_carterae.AAC.1
MDIAEYTRSAPRARTLISFSHMISHPPPSPSLLLSAVFAASGQRPSTYLARQHYQASHLHGISSFFQAERKEIHASGGCSMQIMECSSLRVRRAVSQS